MAQPVGPSFVPKAALTVGRVVHQPFEVPGEMTKSALLQGGATHAFLGSANKAAADAVKALEPRGPAKLLERLFSRVDSSLVGSAEQAKKATEVFWVPFSNGAHEIGHSVSNPFALFYAKRAGFEMPAKPEDAQALLASITDPVEGSTKFPGFHAWPVPVPKAEPAPAPKDGDGTPPADPSKDAPKPTEPPKDGDGTPPTDKPKDGTPPADPPKDAEAPTTAGAPAGGDVSATETSGSGDAPAPTDGPVSDAPSDTPNPVPMPETARSVAPTDIAPTDAPTPEAPVQPPAAAPIDAAAGAQAVTPG